MLVLDFIFAVLKSDGPLPGIELIRWLIEAEVDSADIAK
jgi:hypothetical protein